VEARDSLLLGGVNDGGDGGGGRASA